MKPQEPIPHNHAMSRLNAICAFSAILLLVTTVLTVGYDYVRGWKWFQLEFMQLQADRIEQDLKAADDAQTRQKLADLDQHERDQNCGSGGLLRIPRVIRRVIENQKCGNK